MSHNIDCPVCGHPELRPRLCPLCREPVLESQKVVSLKSRPYLMGEGVAHLECADEALRNILDARADERAEYDRTRGV